MPRKLAALAIALAVSSFAVSSAASAPEVFPPGTTGYDISWPQCSLPAPALTYGFGIVGATGGKAFTHNPCLAAQYAAAAVGGHQPSLYMNLKSPVGTNAEEALSGPRGSCRADDQACQAYNFGYKSAQDAVAYANSQQATAASWWLDIETMSSWSTDTAMNALVIGGALDFLRGLGASVGIYSTPTQWGQIAGTYSPGLPVWVTTAPNAATAPSFCSRGFGGGQVVLVQYLSGIYDVDYACTAADRLAVAASAPIGPPGSRVMIATDGDCLNVRAQAGFAGSPIACLASGTQLTVLDGSVVTDGYQWQLVSGASVTGWVAGNYLRGVTTSTLPVATPAATVAPVATPALVPGVNLRVWNGGSVERLTANRVRSLWVTVNGEFVGYIAGAPDVVNAAFRAIYPDGELAASTAVVLVL